MPAPDHLLPILDKLGDGATVALAETVHQMLADASATATAAAIPPDVAVLERLISTTKAHFQRRCETLTERAERAEAELEQIKAAVVELAPAPTTLTVAGEVEAGKWYLLREPADFTDDGALEVAAQLEKLHEMTGANFVIVTSDGDLTELACPDGVDPESWALMLAQWAMPRRYLTTEADGAPDETQPGPAPDTTEAERIARTGTNTTGSDAAVDIDWDDDETKTQLAAAVREAKDMEGYREPTNADVRAWCIEHGVPVNTKGAIRADARAAYDAAHQEA